MEDTKKCQKCGGEMEEGIIPDAAHFNIPTPPKWVAKIKLLTWKDDSKEVKTFRCKSCGYLESYAS